VAELQTKGATTAGGGNRARIEDQGRVADPIAKDVAIAND
jgi:hypothetical protein